MSDATARPQDVGRRHRRKGAPSTATAALLDEYHDAMRAELRAILSTFRPKPAEPGLFGTTLPASKPIPIGERARLWDLAIKLGRELGGAIEAPAPAPDDPEGTEPPAPRRRGRIEW